MRVLSMDPGTANFGITVLDAGKKGDKMGARIVGTCMFGHTIKVPTSLPQHRAFRAAIWALEHHYGPFDLVCAERFQSRGLKGLAIESINMMLAIVGEVYPNATFYTASTWKNAFNRMDDLNAVYNDLKEVNKEVKKSERHQIHEFDSSLMGMYCAAKHFDVTPFENIDGRIDKYIQHFVNSEKLVQKV